MATASKRKPKNQETPVSKRPRISGNDCLVRRALLEQHYARVHSLRDHVLFELPASSKIRRRKIINVGRNAPCTDRESRLVQLLDNALVCTDKAVGASATIQWEQWQSFSQQCDESHETLLGGTSTFKASQSDIVDFVIWYLFSVVKQPGSWPKHLLCDGFRKIGGEASEACPEIPGVFRLYVNANERTVRDDPWPQLLSLLGQSGEKVMIHLLTNCSIFLPVEAGFNNLYQLSGIPFSELSPLGGDGPTDQKPRLEPRKPSAITLMRTKIFYAKPALNASGSIHAGFRHIHVLHRCGTTQTLESGTQQSGDGDAGTTQQRVDVATVKLMMYMFPRQFGLHNVFTSEVDTTKTAQKFQDYTVRQDEIDALFPTNSFAGPAAPKIPKRLRGTAKELVEQFQVLHNRCSYFELLQHYCPYPQGNRRIRQTAKHLMPIPGANRQDSETTRRECGIPSSHSSTSIQLEEAPAVEDTDVVELATPVANVSAFCQATLSKVIPDRFWGEDTIQAHNKAMFLRKVDHFVKLRRFETTSLCEVSQGLKIPAIAWLQGPVQNGQKPCQSDTNKRIEIFHEFLYFVFDSLLIPLLRTNFYVTESNIHRYRIFFFRHEVWMKAAEPAMGLLKQNMFEELKPDTARGILGSRKLGYSQIRLLPKGKKMRPIMNLRRRQMLTTRSRVLGPSINTVLAPVHTMLRLERDTNSAKLGSTMFSVGDIYDRLKEFRARVVPNGAPVFFAKVDVQAAFDTMPQDAVVELMGSVPAHNTYTLTKHAEVKPGEQAALGAKTHFMKPIRRWHSTASPGTSRPRSLLAQLNSHIAGKKRNTLFVNSSVQQKQETRALLRLLGQHVQHNLVKIGKKYYRQKVGIPQGSVLSSFLCNYFYAELEAKHLSFLDCEDSLLLRLIDDFLLITLDKSKAKRFVEAMHRGIPSFGVAVNHAKTLANFNMSIDGTPVQILPNGRPFPYCGTLINCQSLEISKDRSRDVDRHVFNSLTVDYGRLPGQNFQRKILNAFKIQSHLMFFDTSHNSVSRVLKSLREAFIETATKMWAYMRCLPASKHPSNGLIIGTITKVIDVAFLLLTGQSRKSRYPAYKCSIRKTQITSTAYAAFLEVVQKRQAKYTEVISWLREEAAKIGSVSASSTC